MLDVLVDMTALNTPSRERGIGRYVKHLCRALATRDTWPDAAVGGHHFQIAGLTRHRGAVPGALDESLQFSGDPQIRVSNWQYQRHKLERRLFLGGLAQRVGPRLLHLPDPPGTPLDMRQPRIVTCHDLIPLVLAKQYLAPVPGARSLQWLRDYARYRTARRVIAISDATRRDLIEHVGVSPERIDVVHSGVDHERFSAQALEGERAQVVARLGFDAPFLLCLGASDVRKNLPLLVRAFGQSGVARDLMLVFAGPISPRQRARLLEAIRGSQIEDRVLILGYIDDALLVALYRQCLAYVFPSSYEGFGLPILEAMACGAATLTSGLSSLAEVAGTAALILPSLDQDVLADGIRRITSDSALRSTLRQRGLEHVKAFTWERCAQQTLACYARALEQGAS
ncbi:MAG TPA: glycosyltransferase family 1 protein [Polyangiaceae bacterium]|nr:glycosyltransferase family 1 protein [Polyangiaceae bacterium]